MPSPVSVFLDFNLPNATTWFYFSLLLAVAIFFKFSRLVSIRNLDILTLFLLVPGLMVIQGTRSLAAPATDHPALQIAGFVGHGSLGVVAPLPAFLGGAVEPYLQQRKAVADTARWLWLGYLWLMCGSGVLFVRCLFDLTLVQRPMLGPNLSFGGLAWFGFALIVCLSAVAFRQQDRGFVPSTSAALTVPSEGIPNPQGKTGPESAFVTAALQKVEPTPIMMRGFAVVGHLAVVLGLMVIGRMHFQDAVAGMAAATFYLLLPYTGMFVRQVDHVWPIALIVWTLVAYRRPSVAGFMLGLATGSLYFPVVLFPLLVSFYWRRGAGRFVFFFLLGVALVGGSVALYLDFRGELEASIRRALDLASWQPWKTPAADSEGIWTGVHAAYRIPVFITYVSFVLATAFWPMPKNLAHVLALSSAVLMGTQFWYGDQGGTYVLWYLPLLLLVVFRPNLDDRLAPAILPDSDWVARSKAFVGRWFRSRKPEITKAA